MTSVMHMTAELSDGAGALGNMSCDRNHTQETDDDSFDIF